MRPDARSIAALILVQTLFGLHYLAAKIIVETIPPRPWSLIRAGVSGLILLAFAVMRGIPIPSDRRLLMKFFGLGLIGVAINQYLFVEGLHRTTPGHSALINTSMPVLVVLIALVLGHERPTARRLLGIGITIAGVLLLIGPDRIEWNASAVAGDVITLCNAISYSLFLVIGKPAIEKVRTLSATALLLAFGALWLVPIGTPGLIALRQTPIDARTIALGAFIILGPTIAAYGLNMYALRRLQASVVAFFIYLQPVIGAGLSIALGFERPTARLFIAAAIVFCGVLVALLSPPVEAAPPLASET